MGKPHLNWAPEEYQALRKLLASPDRPGRGLYRWLVEQMAERGHPRSQQSLFKTVKMIREGRGTELRAGQ